MNNRRVTLTDIPPVSDLLNLSGQRILVTGAGSGIGQQIALRLAEAGAELALHYRNNQPDASAFTAEPLLLQADLESATGSTHLLERLDAAEFFPTAVVHNAADQRIAALADMPEEAWQNMLQTNLTSVFSLSKGCAARMSAGGSFVMISSIEGADPAPGHGHYAVSKAGLNMLTRTMALEFGAQNIRVNSVAPGLIHRDGIDSGWPEGVARWREKAPLGRLGDAMEVADAVLFLLSPAARWITGANLVVDGGMSAQSRW